eukprot:2493953-Pleurochrysis_carterae.AAC.1
MAAQYIRGVSGYFSQTSDTTTHRAQALQQLAERSQECSSRQRMLHIWGGGGGTVTVGAPGSLTLPSGESRRARLAWAYRSWRRAR